MVPSLLSSSPANVKRFSPSPACDQVACWLKRLSASTAQRPALTRLLRIHIPFRTHDKLTAVYGGLAQCHATIPCRQRGTACSDLRAADIHPVPGRIDVLLASRLPLARISPGYQAAGWHHGPVLSASLPASRWPLLWMPRAAFSCTFPAAASVPDCVNIPSRPCTASWLPLYTFPRVSMSPLLPAGYRRRPAWRHPAPQPAREACLRC